MKLKEIIVQAQKEKKAIGHFNVSNLETLHGIFEAAREMNVPVIIGVAEGEREFIGTKLIANIIKSYREEYNFPIFLNADHTYSVEGVKEAIDAGFDAVIFDGTKLPFEENVRLTKECVEYARAKNPDILIEAELGFIGSSSKVLEGIPEGVKITEEFLTKPGEAVAFLEATGVDMLAPAVGNIHGMLKGGVDPALNVKRVGEIKNAVNIPLVLHGASGNSAADIKDSINAGVAIVHINTEIRVAYRNALEKSLLENKDELAPYRYMKSVREAVKKVVLEKLKIFENK
ncbi:MAG: class II fructose-bisphosphate aldolase [Minisyncoccia bacterium]